MRPAHRLTSLLAALAFGLVASAAASAKPVTPKKGDVYQAIMDGLTMLMAGKTDKFVDTLCHPETCHNDNAIKSQKRYNAPALSRIAKLCIKAGNTLDVTRVDGDPATDDTVKIFAVCNPKGMPRPFSLKKDGADWKFLKI